MSLTVRQAILEELSALFAEDDLAPPPFSDELVLLETELDSLGFAVLVTRLDDRLGYDPFSISDEPIYPVTLGELIDVYARFDPRV